MGEHIFEKPEGYGEFDTKCPHGGSPGDCKYCDVESDIAYDAWRENQRKDF